MNWKDLGSKLVEFGLPALGAALPVPGGAALGSALASAIGARDGNPEEILSTLQGNSEALMKARQFELEHQREILDLLLQDKQAERESVSRDLEIVNKTIQAELENSDKESWYQKAWRPANGFAVAFGSFAAVLFVCYLFYEALTGPNTAQQITAVANSLPNLVSSLAMLLGVPGTAVGISAWHRGKQKRQLGDTLQKLKRLTSNE